MDQIQIADLNKVKIYSSFAGDIPNGPPYYALYTKPDIENFVWQYYGEWIYIFGQNIYLQQWNTLERPDTNLVVVDSINLTVKNVAEHIPTVVWEMEKNEHNLLLRCDMGDDIFKVKVEEF